MCFWGFVLGHKMFVDKIEVLMLSDSASIVLVIKMPLIFKWQKLYNLNHVDVGWLLIWCLEVENGFISSSKFV